MLKPRYDYKILENSGVITFGSLEQLASDIDPFLQYLLEKKPKNLKCMKRLPISVLEARSSGLKGY